jgi:hypothetical protein
MGSGQLTTGYCHLQLATTLKELGNLEKRNDHFQRAGHHFLKAIYEFEAIGNHRAAAVAENNLGYLLLCLVYMNSASLICCMLENYLTVFRTTFVRRK